MGSDKATLIAAVRIERVLLANSLLTSMGQTDGAIGAVQVIESGRLRLVKRGSLDISE